MFYFIIITKKTKINQLLNNATYSLIKEDNLVTTFNFKDKNIILKSYLINNNRSLDLNSYKNIDKENTLDNKSYQILL